MAKLIKVVVTDKTNFEDHDALSLGDILTFHPDSMEYVKQDGDTGSYSNWWLRAMLDNGSFELVEEDDPLPPVPKGELYINSAGWGLKVAPYTQAELVIATGNPQTPNYGWIGTTVDADTALQIAHDLRRMAMEIKRNQKRG